MEKEQFIKDKIKKLKSEGYSNAQAYAISLNMYNKMQQGGEQKPYYQMAGQYMDTRQKLDMYSNPMDFSIHNPAQENYYDNNNPMFMTQGREQVTQPSQNSDFQYKIGDANLDNTVDAKDQVDKYGNPLKQDRTNVNFNNRVNIMNDPFGGVSMEYALDQAGAGFGSKNYGQAAVGTGLSLVKGARNFLGGFARGKETQRVGQEMMDRRFEDNRLFNWAQQGGKMRNADILAQKAITDQGQGNIEVEDGEYKKDAMTGQIMPIVGEKHQENGKYKGGVKIEAKEGDKFLADYGKAPKEVVSEFSDRFGVKPKKGGSYAELLKTLERGIGQTKLEKEKADKIIALEKAQKTEDKATKELNVNAIQKAIAKTNEKINTLSGVRDEAFEFLFNKQESYPKKGNGQLLDDNGKPIDTNEMVAQQGKIIPSDLPDPVNGIVYEPEGRTYYDSRMDRVVLTPSSSFAPKQAVINHEKFHKYQFDNGGSNFDIAHNTKNALWARMQKKPQLPTTDEVYYDYHNRKGIENYIDVERLKQNPNYKFIPGEILYDKIADREQYENPNSLEGEATQYERSLNKQQGGRIGELAKKHNIPLERAMQLMQEGGEMMPEQQMAQEQGQEQQIMQMVAQLLQEGASPEEVVQQLVSQGVPQEMAIQTVEMVMQQSQGQMMPQEQAPMMQQGGKMKYYQEAGRFDEGYLQVNAPIKGGRYNPKFIPQGQKNKEWFPDSQEAVDYFLENAGTFAKVNPKFKKEFEQMEKDIKSAKTPKERFDILTKSQGQRQQAFWDYAPKELREYVALGYAPTQTELQNTYNSLSPELKTKFEGLLDEQGVDFKGGKIKGGYYMKKGNWNEQNPLYKFINEDVKIQDPKLFESVVSGRINDKQWDRRMENFQTLEFNSIKERDNYAKEKGFEKINDLWVDPKNRNNIIKPLVYRDKKVTPEELKKYNENKNVGEYEGYKSFGEDGIYERWTTEDAPKQVETKTPADLQQFPDQPETKTVDRVKNIMPNLPTYMPMISPLDPLAKQNFNMGRYYFNKGDVENNIAASYNAYDTAQERVQQSGISPWQIEAVSGQNMATHIAGVNEAIARQEALDTQVMVNTEDKNVATAAKEQIMNNQANSVYQDQSLAGINNYRDSLNNAYKEQFLQAQSDRNYIANLNKANTLSNQFAVTPNGVEYLNNREQNPLEMTPEQKQFLDGLPPQQRALWSKAFAQKYGTA